MSSLRAMPVSESNPIPATSESLTDLLARLDEDEMHCQSMDIQCSDLAAQHDELIDIINGLLTIAPEKLRDDVRKRLAQLKGVT